MSDFTVKIDSTLDLSKARGELNKFINKKYKVQLAVDNTSFSQLQKSAKSFKFKPTADTSGIKKANSEIQKLRNSSSSIRIKTSVDTSGINKANAEFSRLKNLAVQISRIRLKISGLDATQNASEIKSLMSQLQQLQQLYNTGFLKGGFNASQLNQLSTIFGNTNLKIDETQAKMGDLANSTTVVKKSFSQLDATTASNKTLTWLKNNTRAAKDYGDVLRDLANKQKLATSASELAGYTEQVNAIKAEAAALGKTGSSMWSNMARGFKQIGQFVGTYGLYMRAVQGARAMANAVIEVDSAITKLRKVSNASDSQLANYFDQATESAKKYGATISEVINSTADWSRLGYGVEDASKLSDATTLLHVVGDNMTQESSSEGLISILKGFQLEANEANTIVSKINEVANTQPIDTAGITAALQRSASSLSAANNSLDESIAMITAANSVVQDPDSVGTAFKTISMRIRGASTELEAAGLETDGMAESTAKLREEMMALSGVDIMLNEDTFKGTYQIMDELADKWQNLTDIQQASVTELIAGKRQGNIMSALMQNWDIAEETLQTSLGSEGSAERELAKYQKSIQYSLDVMKASFQEFSTTALDSILFKSIVDGGTSLLNVLTQIIDVAGGLPALFATIGGISFFKNLDWGKSSHNLICY